MSQPVIEVKNLSKVYNISHEQKASTGNVTLVDTLSGLARKPLELVTGHKMETEQFWALRNVNFEIQKGEAIGIIGRNGSGKSTLLKVLSRIVDPTEGEIRMRGKVASLLEVGTGFHPELTGRENIFFNGAILGMKQQEIRDKFDDIVAFSEVEQFLDTPVKFYSSGMYVRLAFAVAAHLEPDILIVDEVLAVGDAAFQKKCLGKMQDVTGEGRTVLFVSHSMSAVKALCNKAIWMDHGKMQAVGDIEEVADKYLMSSIGTTSDISDRKRTTHVSLEAKITKIEAINQGSEDLIIDSTKPMNISFTVEADQDIDDVVLHCALTASGQTVLRLMSEYTNTIYSLKKGKNVVTCGLDATHLTGGIYGIDCSILRQGQESSGHIDEVFDAATMSVKDLKVEPGGQYLTQKEAVYNIPQNWEKLT